MKIGIITAIPEETGALLKQIGSFEQRIYGNLAAHYRDFCNNSIVLCEAGMCFGNATIAAEMIMREVRPDMLISSGFCGGIIDGLCVGDVVVAIDVAIVNNALIEKVPVEIPAICCDFVTQQTAWGKRVFRGQFVSSPVIRSKAEIAAMLPKGVPCPVVEMESGAIALIAAKHGIPFVGMRSVTDPVGEELAFSLDELCDDHMRIRIPRVLSTIIRRPHIIPQLIRLANNCRRAGASLARCVEQFLKFV